MQLIVIKLKQFQIPQVFFSSNKNRMKIIFTKILKNCIPFTVRADGLYQNWFSFFLPLCPRLDLIKSVSEWESSRYKERGARGCVWLWIDASLLSVWDIKKFKIIIIKCTFNDVLCRYEQASCMEIYNWKNDLYMTGNIIVLCGGCAVLRKKYENNSFSIPSRSPASSLVMRPNIWREL